MSTATTTTHDRAGPLRHRVSATEAMIQQIDDKLTRLNSARIERVAALNRIRCELARALSAEQAAAERHEYAKR